MNNNALIYNICGYNVFGQPKTKTVSAAGCTARVNTVTYDPKGRFIIGTANSLSHTASQTCNDKTGTFKKNFKIDFECQYLTITTYFTF